MIRTEFGDKEKKRKRKERKKGEFHTIEQFKESLPSSHTIGICSNPCHHLEELYAHRNGLPSIHTTAYFVLFVLSSGEKNFRANELKDSAAPEAISYGP